MKKIPSLFVRNYDTDRLVTCEIVPGTEWVIKGEGWATQKFDGTACMVRDGRLYKRHDCKKGKTPPAGFEPCQEPDPMSGHWPGWIPVDEGPENKYYNEAYRKQWPLENGTYELIGPKVNGNPEHQDVHVLRRHGDIILEDCPRTYEGIKEYLRERDIEGIVWHHPDGRMAKIKKRDFWGKR